MAGLKKKKDSSGSPNVVLVVFLVLFVLIAIGTGVACYYGYAGQYDLKKDLDKQEPGRKAAEKAVDYYRTLYWDLRLAVGMEISKDDEPTLQTNRKTLFDGGYAKSDPKWEDNKKDIEELRKKLGQGDNDHYKSNYKKELDDAQAEIKKLEGSLKAESAAKLRMENLSKDYFAKLNEFKTGVDERLVKNNNAAVALAQTNRDNFMKISENNRQLIQDIKKKDEDIQALKEEQEKEVKALNAKIKVLIAERAELTAVGPGGAAPIVGRPSGDVMPLMLDISTGKPLWDMPVGKIIRVDLDIRQVAINLGSAHGVVPDLTFNIFGAGPNGRADKQMKGTIEVVKVLDSATSLCRITSLYDAEGREILLNVDTRTRLQRETETALKEGDLLFNMFWGTRVAVVGYVSITGDPTDNPAEQIRQMEDFMFLLRRNGIQVDAFVDMRDGQIRGNITARTRYVIKGDDLRAATDKPAVAPPAKEGDDKDKEMAKDKEPAKDPGAAGERNDKINASNLALRKEAIERGLLLISSENFANVIGFRKARNANSAEVSAFRPMLPYAGSVESGVIRERKDDEKKDMEKKDMEKKDEKKVDP